MDWEHLLSTYGYVAVLIGTFLEGETILLMAGFAAHRGYLQLPWIITAAFFGSFAGDQLFFFIGRLHGRKFLDKHPSWGVRIAHVHRLMQRWRAAFILGFRFLYGLRTVSPFVLGTSDVQVRQFFFLNMMGAALWAGTVGGCGYAFGEVMEKILGQAQRAQKYALLTVAIVAFAATAVVHWRRRAR